MRYDGPLVHDCGACPYLPDRDWQSLAIRVDEISPEEVDAMLERGFRRSYREFYTPICEGCEECLGIRVPVAGFKPTKSQRQVWKRNQDLEVAWGPPTFTREKYDLYTRYQKERWGKESYGEQVYKMFQVFHYGNTLEFLYRLNGELLGVGLVDTTPRAASSVYFSYIADASRRLGTFSMLYEIDWCQRTGRDYLYMGLYIKDCRTMSYKAGFGPYELLERGGTWRAVTAST